MPRERMIDTARRVYRSYGFSPIDTPALEYLEILLGKGSDETDKQLYRFQDHGGRDVGLRFDLTVPLARFAAQHIGELGTPFKRYHIATVWRGENTQRGRYREFMQCDFDTIGTTRVAADIETVLVDPRPARARSASSGSRSASTTALVLNGLLEKLGLAERVGRRAARARQARQDRPRRASPKRWHATAGATAEQAERVVALVAARRRRTTTILDAARAARRRQRTRRARRRPAARTARRRRSRRRAGRARRSSTSRSPAASTTTPARSSRRCSTTCPTIGSVCSGGRYDNLAELYTKQQLPGIGASLGLDRLLAAMEELGTDRRRATRRPRCSFRYFDAARLGDYFQLGRASCAPPASASKSIPSRRSSASNSNTPTARASASPSSPANANSPPASAR